MELAHIIESVHQLNQNKGESTLHPLITVFSQERKPPMQARLYKTNLYLIFLKDSFCADIVYGRKTYDYQEGTLVFMAPGQEFGLEYVGLPPSQPNGWSIAFHPDLLKGTSLQRSISQFQFFSYAVNEALHISQKERTSITEMFLKLRHELERPTDKHSRDILVSNLELFFKYCQRFYERQFHTRAQENLNLSAQLTMILEEYMNNESLLKSGPPNVRYCAQKLSLSPNYFGDLTRQQLGLSAQEFIQSFLIEVAKEKLASKSLNINEIAFALGFEYPNHFSRFFKNQTGTSPSDYRLNLN
jgi:AraC-like DNA-binding protein